jgi:hypothetical protein
MGFVLLAYLIGLTTFVIVRMIPGPGDSIWWSILAGAVFWIGVESFSLIRR